MKCIYSIATDFARHGIGTTSYYAVRGLYRAGMLKKLLCTCHKKTEIPENLIKDVFPGGKIAAGLIEKAAILFGSANGYAMRDTVYDNLACTYINDCDIFHGWALESVKSLAVAKKQGAKYTIIERPNAHILKQKEILECEYKKYNFKKIPIDNAEIERSIAAYEKADYVLVPSEFACKSFLDLDFDKGKIIVIPYGYDRNIFKPGTRKDNIFRVLFCGNVTLRKGIIYLLKAWEKLNFKNAELVLIGRVFNEMKGLLEKYISKHASIKIKGFVPYNEIVNYYHQADVFVLPSLEEGSALVNYEAMACGLPVITTFNSGSVVRDGIDGFIVKPQDAAGLCDKIQHMYDNKQKCRQMGFSALEYVKNYTWEKYSEKLCAFYNQLFRV